MQQADKSIYHYYTVCELANKLLLAGTAYSIKVLNNYKGVK